MFSSDHASVMTGGSRGSKAWIDSASTWSEYGNIHSVSTIFKLKILALCISRFPLIFKVMGSGNSQVNSPQYLIEGNTWMRNRLFDYGFYCLRQLMNAGKMMFDWIDDTYIQSVVPFSSAGVGLCNPQCGP